MHIRHLIGGRDVDSEDGRFFDDITPIDNTVVATVALGSATEVDRAVAATRRAFPAWSRTSVQERRVFLERIADAVEARAEELAELDTRDMGAPISAMRAIGVPKSVETLRFFGEWAEQTSTDAYHRPEIGVLSYTVDLSHHVYEHIQHAKRGFSGDAVGSEAAAH